MALAAGTRLGPYEVLALIGEGGTGEVYRARDTRLERTVAIKVLTTDDASPDRRALFEREAHTIAQLAHPHICGLYDVGTHDGATCLGAGRQSYDVSRDGQRFPVVQVSEEERTPRRLHLVQNWLEELKARVPGRSGG